MNMTSNADLSSKSASETVLPSVSGNLKSGAVMPRGSIVEGVSAMHEIWNGSWNFASGEVLEFRL